MKSFSLACMQPFAFASVNYLIWTYWLFSTLWFLLFQEREKLKMGTDKGASSKGQRSPTIWANAYCPPILFLMQIFSVCFSKNYFCSLVHKDKWDILKGTRKELPLSSESFLSRQACENCLSNHTETYVFCNKIGNLGKHYRHWKFPRCESTKGQVAVHFPSVIK